MDLVLLKPGNVDLETDYLSLIDGEVQASGEDLSGAVELVSCNYGMAQAMTCLLYTSPTPPHGLLSRMRGSA